MVFLVPTVVGGALPPEFAVPAAYGDLLAALLALLAIVARRARWSIAIPLVWCAGSLLSRATLGLSRAHGARYNNQSAPIQYRPCSGRS